MRVKMSKQHPIRTYCEPSRPLPYCIQIGEVRFFGRGGMRAGHVPNEEWRQLKLYSPDYVVLHLGGNDLSMESVPRLVGWLFRA